MYITNRLLIINNGAENEDINWLGEGRCNSLGYNAKYGTYTVSDKNSGLIHDFNVLHVRIVGNSARMELDGLKQVLVHLEGHGLPIWSLITDRHKQVLHYRHKREGQNKPSIWCLVCG